MDGNAADRAVAQKREDVVMENADIGVARPPREDGGAADAGAAHRQPRRPFDVSRTVKRALEESEFLIILGINLDMSTEVITNAQCLYHRVNQDRESQSSQAYRFDDKKSLMGACLLASYKAVVEPDPDQVRRKIKEEILTLKRVDNAGPANYAVDLRCQQDRQDDTAMDKGSAPAAADGGGCLVNGEEDPVMEDATPAAVGEGEGDAAHGGEGESDGGVVNRRFVMSVRGVMGPSMHKWKHETKNQEHKALSQELMKFERILINVMEFHPKVHLPYQELASLAEELYSFCHQRNIKGIKDTKGTTTSEAGASPLVAFTDEELEKDDMPGCDEGPEAPLPSLQELTERAGRIAADSFRLQTCLLHDASLFAAISVFVAAIQLSLVQLPPSLLPPKPNPPISPTHPHTITPSPPPYPLSPPNAPTPTNPTPTPLSPSPLSDPISAGAAARDQGPLIASIDETTAAAESGQGGVKRAREQGQGETNATIDEGAPAAKKPRRQEDVPPPPQQQQAQSNGPCAPPPPTSPPKNPAPAAAPSSQSSQADVPMPSSSSVPDLRVSPPPPGDDSSPPMLQQGPVQTEANASEERRRLQEGFLAMREWAVLQRCTKGKWPRDEIVRAFQYVLSVQSLLQRRTRQRLQPHWRRAGGAQANSLQKSQT